MTLPTRRPGLVTLLLILVVIEGLFSIFIGLLFVLARDSATVNGDLVADGATGSSVALWLGILLVVIGVVYLLIARGLANGNRFARLLVAAVTVVNIVGGLWLLVAHPGAARWSTLASILLGVIVLAILYSPKASAFFRSN
jgi:hypothetical protein